MLRILAKCWKHGKYSMRDEAGCSMHHHAPRQEAMRRRMKALQARMVPFLTASLSRLPSGQAAL